ncbi:MAG: hypothetical protein NTU43_01625 [Bacteroidetes bacterium]|nr:hypothetical protein [Bacteroidota bacterium]
MHSKIKYKLPFFCLLIISILLINACNKDEKKNPCAGYIRPQAGFTIQDDARITYGKETGIVLSTDTVYSQSDIMFTSLLDYDTYQWRVVGDPDFVKTTKSFKLIFKANFSIDMQLIGKRKPNTTCDPDDDGIDTIVRSIVVLNSDSSLGQILGKYTHVICQCTVILCMEDIICFLSKIIMRLLRVDLWDANLLVDGFFIPTKI